MKLWYAQLRWLAVASTLPLAGVAHAQIATVQGDEANEQNEGLQEIVVTAQKRSESLQRVPIAITAADSRLLTATGIQAQSSLPQITPNLQIQSIAQYVSPILRGVGTFFVNPGLESTVSVYLDDSYVTRTSSGIFSFSDIERVEVLKGPQGTLYGRNSTGGAIRIITKEPTEKFEAGASGAYGNYDRVQLAGYGSGPLADNLFARIAINYNDRDGYVKRSLPANVYPNTVISNKLPALNDQHEVVVLGKARWEPTDRLTVKLGVDYADKNDYNGVGWVPGQAAPLQLGLALGAPASPCFYCSVQDAPLGTGDRQKYHETDYGVQLRVNYELDAATLSSITTYRKLDLKSGLTDIDATSVNLVNYDQSQYSNDYTQEFQAVSNGDGSFKWTVGVYMLKETAGFNGGVYGDAVANPPGTPPLGAQILFASDGQVKVDSVAPYGQASYKFTDMFELILGARYTLETKKLTFNHVYLQPKDMLTLEPLPGTSRTLVSNSNPVETSFKAFTPRITLNVTPTRDTLFYATYSKGFKSGGFNLPAFSQPTAVQPEKLTSYEFGWKTQFGNLRINGAAFYYDYKDLQVTVVDTSQGGSTFQNATARIKGLELESVWAPARGLELGFGGGHLDAKFRKFLNGTGYAPNQGGSIRPGGPPSPPSAACTGTGTDGDPSDNVRDCAGVYATAFNFGGNRLPYSAKWTAYFRARYEIGLGEKGSLTPSAILSYSSRYYHDNQNVLPEKSRYLLNASLSWLSANEMLGASLFGENLTKTKYLSNWGFDGTGGFKVPAPPSMYGLRVSVKY